eukprot:3810226-Karenia_brevis.AAC.1
MVCCSGVTLSSLKTAELSTSRLQDEGRELPFRLGNESWVPSQYHCYWSEHSERAVLKGWAAVPGLAKDERDKLGPWQASHSDDYLRAARATVFETRSKVAEALRRRGPRPIYDELFYVLQEYGHMHSVQQDVTRTF